MLFAINSKSNIQNFFNSSIFYVPFTIIVKDSDNIFSKQRLDRAKFTC